jgi:transposase
MKYLSADRLICMDGIHFNPKDNLDKFGWADSGREAVVFQIVIESRSYAVHAAMSEYGFIAWDIFDGDVCGSDVSSFIKNKLSPVFQNNSFLLLDNAANQRTDEVIATMESSLGGRFVYNVEYSPELNPIERGFSLIRRWIRNNEQMYLGRHVLLINSAFNAYSVEGPFGDMVFMFFELYRKNHECFLHDISLNYDNY